jgi:hypothetical protein
MGQDRWGALAYDLREKYFDSQAKSSDDTHVPLAFTREGSSVVWAACLRDRNHELISRWTAKKRQEILSLEGHLFRFGMACIALENTLAGGGTYVNHQPQFMWNDEERGLYLIVKDSPAPAGRADMLERLNQRLTKYTSMKTAPNLMLSDRPANLIDIRRFAQIARAEFAATEEIGKNLSLRQRQNVLAFEKQYLVDYLGIRGADGTPEKSS